VNTHSTWRLQSVLLFKIELFCNRSYGEKRLTLELNLSCARLWKVVKNVCH